MASARVAARTPLLLLLLVALVLGLGLGAVAVGPTEIAGILASRLPVVGGLVPRDWPASHETIVLYIRLPRVVLGALVGAGLALAGLTFQGLFRNPMADPFIIGTSSGAALGAVTAMALSLQFRLLGLGAVPLMAFLGAMLSIMAVYRLAQSNGRVPVETLLLAGIAAGSFLSAVVSLIIVFSGEKVGQILFWLMGGLSGANWRLVAAAGPYFLLSLLVLLAVARELNAFVLGEEPAATLGVAVETFKRILLAAASLLTATAVAVSGMIGFVGLITPHVVRLLVGPDHRLLIPLSAVAGAAFLVIADTLARTLVSPAEIPAGVVTALFGGPFFIYLLVSRGRKVH